MKWSTAVLMGLAMGLLGAGVSEGAVFMDPDAMSDGAVLNHAFPGVTLRALGGAHLPDDRVFARQSGLASTGSLVFGHSYLNGTLWGGSLFEYLRADFAAGATWVAIDAIANDTNDRNATMIAFDFAGNLVDKHATDFGVPLPMGVPVTLTVSAPEIAFIVVSWDPILKCDNGALDSLRFVSVPEPSSIVIWLLVLLTLAAAAHWRR